MKVVSQAFGFSLIVMNRSMQETDCDQSVAYQGFKIFSEC